MFIKLGEKAYNIEYTYNSICLIETLLGMGIGEMLLRGERLQSLSTVRAFLTAGLYEHNPEISEIDAGNLIQAYIKKGGTIDSLSNRLTEAMKASGLLADRKGPQNTEKKSHGPTQ